MHMITYVAACKWGQFSQFGFVSTKRNNTHNYTAEIVSDACQKNHGPKYLYITLRNSVNKSYNQFNL